MSHFRFPTFKKNIVSVVIPLVAIVCSPVQGAQSPRGLAQMSCHQIMSTVQLLGRHTHLEGDEAISQLARIAKGCYHVITLEQSSRQFANQLCITYATSGKKRGVILKWTEDGNQVHTLKIFPKANRNKVELLSWPEDAEAPQIHYEAVLKEDLRRWHSRRQTEVHFRIGEDGTLAYINVYSKRHIGPFQRIWRLSAKVLFQTE